VLVQLLSVVKELAAASSVEETVLLQHSDGMQSVSYCAIRIQTTRVFGIICSRTLSDMYRNNKTALGVFRDVVQRLYRDIHYFQKLVAELTFVDTSLAEFYPNRTKNLENT
jgi:hypothetical protein